MATSEQIRASLRERFRNPVSEQKISVFKKIERGVYSEHRQGSITDQERNQIIQAVRGILGL